MTTHWIQAGLAGALGVLLLAGCTQSTQESSEVKDALGRVTGGLEQQARGAQQTLPVGGTLTLPAGQSLTVVRVGAELAGVSAPAGERLVVLQVDLANPDGAPLPLHPAADFWLTDGAGRRYLPQATAGLPARRWRRARGRPAAWPSPSGRTPARCASAGKSSRRRPSPSAEPAPPAPAATPTRRP